LRFNVSAPGTELGPAGGMTCTHANPHGRRGFTLLELMLVLVIMGLMAAMAGPRMVRWIQTIGQRGAFNQLMSDLALARIQAVRQGTTVSLRIIDEDTYRVTVDSANGSASRTLKQVDLSQMQRGATLDPDSGRIAFDSRGVLRPSPVSTITQITLTRGPVSKRLRVTGVGRTEVDH
jgi:type II secretion system protein H